MKSKIAYVMTIGCISMLPSIALYGQVNHLNIEGTYEVGGVAGALTLTQNGHHIQGVYANGLARLEGILTGTSVRGTFENQAWNTKGEFEWTFRNDTAFEGWWRNTSPDNGEGVWNGIRMQGSFSLHFIRAADRQELETLTSTGTIDLYVEARCGDSTSKCFASDDWKKHDGTLSWGEGRNRSITFSRIDATTLRSEVFTVLPSASSETDNESGR